MGVGTHDHIGTPVCQRLGQSLLCLGNGVAVLHSPMDAYHHKICVLSCRPYLLLYDIRLAGINDVGRHFAVLRNAIGMLCIGKIGDPHPLDRLDGDAAIVGFAFPQSGGDHVLRHRFPEAEGGGNAGSALIIGVVVREAEHPEPRAVQRLRALARSREAGVGRRLQFSGTEGLLVDPIDVLSSEEGVQILITLVKAIALSFRSPAGAACL